MTLTVFCHFYYDFSRLFSLYGFSFTYFIHNEDNINVKRKLNYFFPKPWEFINDNGKIQSGKFKFEIRIVVNRTREKYVLDGNNSPRTPCLIYIFIFKYTSKYLYKFLWYLYSLNDNSQSWIEIWT